jgi:hypothetical protein
MAKIESSEHLTTRRSFIHTGIAVGAGTLGAARLLVDASPAFASGGLTAGDAAILRFLAAAEILETDLWQQYNELGGIQDDEVPGGSGNTEYTEALEVLDDEMPQYIHDNTEDEISHVAFINAYLESKGAEPVNLDRFRTLPSSQASGADSRRSFPGCSRGSSRASPERMRTSLRPTTCRPSRTPQPSISGRSSKGAAACIPRWRSASHTPKCCASSSPSAPRRPCTSRSGTTRPATHLP